MLSVFSLISVWLSNTWSVLMLNHATHTFISTYICVLHCCLPNIRQTFTICSRCIQVFNFTEGEISVPLLFMDLKPFFAPRWRKSSVRDPALSPDFMKLSTRVDAVPDWLLLRTVFDYLCAAHLCRCGELWNVVINFSLHCVTFTFDLISI